MTEREQRILKTRLMPQVRKAEFKDGPEYCIRESCSVELKVPADCAGEATQSVRSLFSSYWKTVPHILVSQLKTGIPPEGYHIAVNAKKLTVSASGKIGVLYALRTLRQLAEPERNTEIFSCHILPQCTIFDEPALGFRGIHFTWLPEISYEEMEKQLRLAAYFKYNHVVIEPWGIYPYKSHPGFCFADMHIRREDMKQLIDLAYELSITPIPQITLLGHASFARIGAGKHAVLDSHSEYASLMEPDGWAWCITNPATRRILSDLVEELHSAFRNPPYFHIGCDEAFNLATCASCRKHPLDKLILDHIVHFHDLLAKRGAKTIMWHDMLISRDDPRWAGYTANGLTEEECAKLRKKLPKDILVCDWQYGCPVENSKVEWPTSLFFKNEGFTTLVSPWLNEAGCKSLARFAARNNLFGLITTTWHKNRGPQLFDNYVVPAGFAWNPETEDFNWTEARTTFNRYLRHAVYDMGVQAYNLTGSAHNQIAVAHFPE